MLDAIGWVATAVFSVSYLCRDGRGLRRVQALAALLWIAYGVAIASKPVIAANAIVALAALGSSAGGIWAKARRAAGGTAPQIHR